MQIGYNLHEMSQPFPGKSKKNVISSSFVELDQTVGITWHNENMPI